MDQQSFDSQCCATRPCCQNDPATASCLRLTRGSPPPVQAARSPRRCERARPAAATWRLGQLQPSPVARYSLCQIVGLQALHGCHADCAGLALPATGLEAQVVMSKHWQAGCLETSNEKSHLVDGGRNGGQVAAVSRGRLKLIEGVCRVPALLICPVQAPQLLHARENLCQGLCRQQQPDACSWAAKGSDGRLDSMEKQSKIV